MRLMQFILFLLIFNFFSVSNAKEINMVQSDKTFLGNIPPEKIKELFTNPLIEREYKVEELELKVGDSIKFKNRDEVNHNVSGSIGEEKVFDVTLQEPGEKNDRVIKLEKPGEYIIQCAIHPKMKINLEVNE